MVHDKDTEQRILDAAHAVFMRRGTAGARTQEIAEEAGVNKALLHYYFRSKERLAEAVFVRAARQLLPPVIAVLASDASIEEKVRGVVKLELEIVSRTPFLPAYLIGEFHHHPERVKGMVEGVTGASVDGFMVPVMARLGAQIEEEVRAGRMRPIGPEEFAINLLSLCLFPFAIQPMLRVGMRWQAADFNAFIEHRKTSLADFYIASLRP